MYRAYIRVTRGDDGRPLGRTGLEPLAENLRAHVDEAFAEVVRQGYRQGYAGIGVATHLSRPVIRVEVDEAWEARTTIRTIQRFLRATGWGYSLDLNANTRRAL